MVENRILIEDDKVGQLKEIFPDVDENIIYEVLVQCGDSIEDATEVLFCMKGEEISIPQSVKESFIGLSDSDLEKIKRDLEGEQNKKLRVSKQEDEDIQKALNASMKQLKIDQKKHEKEVKRMENEEKRKKEDENVKIKPKKISFGQKLKNLFKKKKTNTVEAPEDIEIPDIKHPPESIQD